MDHIRVNLSNMNNKWIEFGLANIDTFIIRVGFKLTNIDTFIIRDGFRLTTIDTICTLTRHEHDPSIRITTLIYLIVSPKIRSHIISRIPRSLSRYDVWIIGL